MNALIKVKSNFINLSFVFLCILQFFVAQISNYKFSSLLLKLVFLIISFFSLNIIFTYYQIPLKTIIKKINSYFKVILICFIIFPLITIFYSYNPIFGLIKWLNLLFGLITSIILFYCLILLILLNKIEIYPTIETLIITSLIILVILFIIKPFNYSGNYSLLNLEFSHVLFGRFYGLLTIITFYLILITSKIEKIYTYSLSALLFLIGAFFISHRVTLIGIILLLPILYLLLIKRINIKFINKIFFILTFITGIIVSISFNIYHNRNYELIKLLKNKSTNDSSITTRLEIYKTTLERIKENLILGEGFGGFNRYYKTNLPQLLKYPHNIFLETQLELGIIGTILLIYLLYMIIKNTYKKSIIMFIITLFAILSALFSKDITTQNMLFINIVFINSYK